MCLILKFVILVLRDPFPVVVVLLMNIVQPSPSIMKCGPPPKGAKREVSTKPVKPVQPVASSSKLPSIPAKEFITIDSSDDESEEDYATRDSAFDIDNGSNVS